MLSAPSSRIPLVLVQATSREAMPDAMAQATDVLRTTHDLTPDDPLDFTVFNAGDLAQAAESAAAALQLFSPPSPSSR